MGAAGAAQMHKRDQRRDGGHPDSVYAVLRRRRRRRRRRRARGKRAHLKLPVVVRHHDLAIDGLCDHGIAVLLQGAGADQRCEEPRLRTGSSGKIAPDKQVITRV